MLTPTHLITAQTAYLAACLSANHSPAPPEAAIAMALGILPDIDHRQGLIGRMFPPLSEWLEHQFGHRTFTHSLLILTAATLLAWWLLPAGYALAVFAGLASHHFSDMMTPSGCAWFWPSRTRCVLPGNSAYRMEPMGWGEFSFGILMGALGLVFMALADTTQGTGGVIRAAIGNIASARQQYDAEKGRNAWTLRLEGRNNKTFATIEGEYPILGPWKESGFIVDADPPRSVCKSSSCDWYADHAVAVKGQPEHTTTTTIQADMLNPDALREALRGAQSAGGVLLVGTLETPSVRTAPPAVDARGTHIALNYAPAAMIEGWTNTLRDVDLVIQVRHAPGVTPPPIQVEGTSTAVIDDLLLKWVEP